MRTRAARFQHGAEVSNGGSLTIGARDMDAGRQTVLRSTQGLKHLFDPRQAEVYYTGVETPEVFQRRL
ncbi:hypothetical protein GCM10009069_26740 [Algimonas arctica]|uniref:Uncharacterized protein n=1 Tax=Algimonas arctica TaxID=1479486 RepID=A0A8J3CRT2_9PROT|nr:hypothetical protein GCM10009069_26740 [Algimonas arctica]